MKRRFYFYNRGSKKIWYVAIHNPDTGERLPARSTGTADREKAEYLANKWYYEGVPEEKTADPRSVKELFSVDKILSDLRTVTLKDNDVRRFLRYFKEEGFINDIRMRGKSSESFCKFLARIWEYETSPYVREKQAHGQRVGKTRCRDCKAALKNYWSPYFQDIPIYDVTRQKLKNFSLTLAEKGLAAATINNIMDAGCVPLRWAHANELIESDPTSGLMRFSGEKKNRGILSIEEAEKLFTKGDWNGNEGARLGNLLAYQTGLRAGEIVFLKVRHLEQDRIRIEGSFSTVEGAKKTKTQENREVPLLPEMRRALLKHAKKNPHGFGPESWIFFQESTKDRPMRQETLNKRLKKALYSIGINEVERKERSISFHSWRHLFAYIISKELDKKVMQLTGWKTEAMLENYSMHKTEADFQKAAEATGRVFSNILPFSQKAAREAVV